MRFISRCVVAQALKRFCVCLYFPTFHTQRIYKDTVDQADPSAARFNYLSALEFGYSSPCSSTPSSPSFSSSFSLCFHPGSQQPKLSHPHLPNHPWVPPSRKTLLIAAQESAVPAARSTLDSAALSEVRVAVGAFVAVASKHLDLGSVGFCIDTLTPTAKLSLCLRWAVVLLQTKPISHVGWVCLHYEWCRITYDGCNSQVMAMPLYRHPCRKEPPEPPIFYRLPYHV